MFINNVKIKAACGIHIRIAAEIVNKAELLKGKYNVNLLIKKSDSREWLAVSMLALLSLKITKNDVIEISAKENTVEGKNAVLELCDFIFNCTDDENADKTKIDDIIEQNIIANEQILKSIPMGIIVIDANCCITSLNEYGLKLINKNFKDVLGKNVRKIIPNSELPAVIESGKCQIGKMQHIGEHIILANRSPIFSGDKVIGAVAVFQDISELIGIKELNERLKRILEASHDLICFVEKMNNKPVVIRTLDIGGDKKLPYLPLPEEMNPFLGYRAIRLCLDRTDIFKVQLRALLRASVFGNLKIMFPMISSLEEFLEAKKLLKECMEELQKEEISFNKDLETGIMVEIPSAAIEAFELAKHVDFFSIGTNDLIQYTLAADRMNEKISYLYNPMHPAVLRLIKMTIDAAHSAGKWCGMCGEMAGDEEAIPTLIEYGLDEFSMSSSSILNAKRIIINS